MSWQLTGIRTLIVGAALLSILFTGTACTRIPSPIRSTSFPSSAEEELNDRYIGKTFVTAEPSFLVPGVFPILARQKPSLAKALPLRAGTPFEIKRLELNQGINLVSMAAGILAGSAPPKANVALARETAIAKLDLHEWERECLKVMNPSSSSSTNFGGPTQTVFSWKLPTGVTVKAVWKDGMPRDDPPLVEKHERDD